MKKLLEVLISGNSDELEASLSKADKSLKEFGKKMSDVGKTMSATITAPLLLLGSSAIKTASDFNESMNKVQVAFKNSSTEVQAFAKTTLRSFGIAEGTALDMAALFGDMSTSMGLSTDQAAKLSTSLVGLAGDLASFKNMNIEEVTTALNGVFTGETESLKRLGVVMTEANLKAFALSTGIKKSLDQMSQGEKVILRYNYVMANTSNAQGDFARTSGGSANQMRSFQEQIKEISNTFGQIMLPAFTTIITKVNELAKGFNNLSPEVKSFIVIAGGIAALAGPLMWIAGTIIPQMITGFINMRKAALAFNATITKGSPILTLAAILGTAAYSAYEYSKAMTPDNKLSEAEKKDANAIREKNKAIYESIALLKQQKSANSGLITGMNTAQGMNTAGIDAQIAAQVKLLQSNRALLKSFAPTTPTMPTSGKGGGLEIGAGTPKVGKASDVSLSQLVDLKTKGQDLIKSLNESFTELLNVSSPVPEKIGDNMALLAFNMQQNTPIFQSTFGLMAQSVNDSTQKQLSDLALLQEAYSKTMQGAEIVSTAVQNAFGALGTSIVDSFGLAKTGFEGFVSSMASGLIELGAMYLKSIIMNQASATASAVKVGADAAAATGPAGIFTIAPLIAMAVGAVASAFGGIPKFAAGGIVSGPTMGLMGEYSGAKSNPEVIAPLNKLQNMIDTGTGSNVNISGEFVVKGQDLLLVLQRANNQKGRIS